MKQNEIIQKFKELAQNQSFAVLATDNKGQPYTSLVAFSLTNDGQSILFTTKSQTQKFRNIQRNPKVSLLIDNRENTARDLKNAAVITILGIAKPIEKNKKYIEVFIGRHPTLRSFVNSTYTALIKIKVEKVIIVSNFQDVQLLSLKDNTIE
jgi:general stress protein 26